MKINTLFLFTILTSLSIIICYDIKCKYMSSVYEPSDCFELGFTSSKTEKCCLLEYRSKKQDRKFRQCTELTLEQFLKIDDTIKNLENKDKDITITSLECDKASFLSLSKYILLLLFIIV